MLRWMFAALVSAVVWTMGPALAAEQSARPSQTITLKDAIERALEASPAVRSREELIVGADAQVRQSGVLPNPELDVEVENFAGSGPFQDFEENELTLAVTQRLERGGKREARVSVAETEREIAAIERDRSRLDVALEARRAYFEVGAASALVDVAVARLTSATQIEAMAARRVQSARDPVTVRLRAEIQTAEARSARDQAELALQTAKRRLGTLWGEPDAPFAVDASALFSTAERGIQAAGEALDVRTREVAARRAASKLELERANARSDISVGLGVRRFESGGDLAGVLSLSVPLAVFDSNQGNIDRAAAEQRSAALDVAEARRAAERERASLEGEAERARAEAITIRKELLPRAEEALRAARRGYDAGAFSYLELSESHRTLADLRTREIEALRRFHTALAELDRLSGRLAIASKDQGQEP